ncbi:lysophospholipase L1-like esterase [Actinomadura pelletieri DSM 43383]|uniref:Lysophospholipase L1-like esterase n=2 Tax=Actinomadura pelletieri TaxID=111805 RepID=A0A495Q9U6_9ACTN|nr:GDSL-type esterase/lipase family protein [Actinomadura pelletieri]RKS68270.1 lysophospholipase L1-like esterase [Actinomadura pelletieri DSM 43383]
MPSRRLAQGLAAVLIAVSAVVAAPAAPPARAIIDGQESELQHGQVVVYADGAYACTGSLIARDWVLTARHCLRDQPMTVRIGSRLRGLGETRDVIARREHGSADLALLQLDRDVTNAGAVIAYDDAQRPINGRIVGVNGWGVTTEGGTAPSIELRSARIIVLNNHADPPRPEEAPPGGAIESDTVRGRTGMGDSGAGVIEDGRVVAVHTSVHDDLMYAVALQAVQGWIWRQTRQLPRWEPLQRENLTTMALGDSITYGIGHSGLSGYRDELRRRLVSEAQSMDFVGSQQSGNLPDRDNEGHPGAMINDIARRADSAVPLHKPNLVLLHAGTNDMDRGDAAGAPAALGSLIDQVIEDAPNTTVLVSTLVPSKNAAVQARIDAFNKQIPGVVAQRARTGKHVAVVDMNEVTTGDLADYLHPNDRGYAKMADEFGDAIRAVAQEGWIADPDDRICKDTPGRWLPRGKIASGTGHTDDESVQFADINGDRRDDYLVVNSRSGVVKAWINAGGDQDGKPGWIPRGQIASGVELGEQEDVDFADINGDRRDDYLVYDTESGAVRAWINIGGDQDGKPGWIPRGQIASGVPDAIARPVFAEIDGDGRDDYLAVDPRTGVVRAWINAGGDQDGKPGWIPRGQIASGVGSIKHGPYFPNIDCDLRDDYVVTDINGGSVRAWLNRGGDQDGKSGWIERGQIASGALPDRHMLAFADIDGDGRDDYLAVSLEDGSVQAWINNGGDPA